MNREVVQDFLNLPGIAGVALMDGRSRPYFCGVDQALNFQQKEALAQGIQQVVETTPVGFEFYEFQFTGHRVHIYKLEHGIILLVLTGYELVYHDYLKAVNRLKAELQEDVANAIATFRLLAGNVTLSSQSYWQRRESTTTTSSSTKYRTSAAPPATDTTSNRTTRNGAVKPPAAAQPPSPSPTAATASRPTPTAPPAKETPINIKEVLAALNHFSQFTTQYLGTTVVTNYWKTTRPDVPWLNNFQVDRSAQISFNGTGAMNPLQELDSEQHQWVQDWTAAFIQRCSRVIRDFPTIIEQRALDDRQKTLLLSDKQ
jgi:hypothetical protein